MWLLKMFSSIKLIMKSSNIFHYTYHLAEYIVIGLELNLFDFVLVIKFTILILMLNFTIKKNIYFLII
jgi:hypothetical protein